MPVHLQRRGLQASVSRKRHRKRRRRLSVPGRAQRAGQTNRARRLIRRSRRHPRNRGRRRAPRHGYGIEGRLWRPERWAEHRGHHGHQRQNHNLIHAARHYGRRRGEHLDSWLHRNRRRHRGIRELQHDARIARFVAPPFQYRGFGPRPYGHGGFQSGAQIRPRAGAHPEHRLFPQHRPRPYFTRRAPHVRRLFRKQAPHFRPMQMRRGKPRHRTRR